MLQKCDLKKKNKEINIKLKDGRTFFEIAQEYKLSTTTISSTCRRIDAILEKRRFDFDKYVSMLKDLRSDKRSRSE